LLKLVALAGCLATSESYLVGAADRKESIAAMVTTKATADKCATRWPARVGRRQRSAAPAATARVRQKADLWRWPMPSVRRTATPSAMATDGWLSRRLTHFWLSRTSTAVSPGHDGTDKAENLLADRSPARSCGAQLFDVPKLR